MAENIAEILLLFGVLCWAAILVILFLVNLDSDRKFHFAGYLLVIGSIIFLFSGIFNPSWRKIGVGVAVAYLIIIIMYLNTSKLQRFFNPEKIKILKDHNFPFQLILVLMLAVIAACLAFAVKREGLNANSEETTVYLILNLFLLFFPVAACFRKFFTEIKT